MTEKREQRQSGSSARGTNDKQKEIARKHGEGDAAESPGDNERRAAAKPSPESSPPWQEPQGIQKGIADADKLARTDSTEEKVRDTPPAGAWNDTSGD